MNLKNKVVVITGASSGIGKELAYQFSRKGSSVVCAARNASALDALVGDLQSHDRAALAVPTDVSDRSQVERLMKKTFERFHRLDILINNAGVSWAQGTLMENKEADVRATLDINFMGGVYGVWAAVPFMEKTGGGQIVFVTSGCGKRGVARNAIYSASKFATHGLTEAIRSELAPKNIHVITAAPPGVDTSFFEHNHKAGPRRFKLYPVEKIAALIVQACEENQREALLTWDTKLLHVLNFFFPSLLDKAMAKAKGIKAPIKKETVG